MLRLLGVKGGQLPKLSEGLQQTIVVADLSRISSAPVERRSIQGATGISPPPAGQFQTAELSSIAAGGIIVEALQVIRAPFTNAAVLACRIHDVKLLGADPLLNTPVPIGQGAPTSAADIGNTAVSIIATGPAGTIWQQATPGGLVDFRNLFWFVPPGKHFHVQQHPVNQAWSSFTITWRELIEGVGPP